jgi:two-component system sensor histidine kinase CpxA
LLATLLVIAAQIGVDWLSSTGPFGGGLPSREHLQRTMAPVLILYGHSAIDRSKSGGREAIARSAKKLKDMSGIDAYLVDPAGTILGGDEAPQNIRDIARKARQTGRTEFSSSKTRELIALPMPGEDGKDYYVVGDIPRMLFGPPPPIPSHMNGVRSAPPPLIFGPGFLFPPGPRPFSLLRLFITLFISGAVCYLLARYLTSPIIRLREAARRFADGDLAARIGGKKARWKDELSELADDFDTMAERIESLMRQQRRLIQDISHELRSPLARLTIATELVRRQGSTVAASTLDRIEKETAALNEMISQVLELTRVESNMEAVEMAPIDLVTLLDEIVADANFEAGARNRAVRFAGGEACIVSGNEEWLLRGIENVIRNAIRYTRDGTTIEINLDRIVEAGTEYARITIRDHGGGVPEKDLPHLFRPFYRVSNARERQTGGSGLGLAITERAVILHHGSATAQNAADEGFIVIIKLPI